MPKYYVSYRGYNLILDEFNPENAAGMALIVAEDLSTRNLIYVDERGHRTKNAEHKFNVLKSFNTDIEKTIWYIKKKK